MGSTPLKQISKEIDIRWEDPVVPHYNGQRSQRAQCSPAPGIETEKSTSCHRGTDRKHTITEGYSLVWQGEKIANDQSMKYLFQNFPLAIILMIAIPHHAVQRLSQTHHHLLLYPMIFVGW